ncbi:MAG: hypothetical protein WC632_05915 [Candidatus Margulisiibacteriota bacterium]
MKKVIIFFVVMAFMASVASVAFGRTIDEEKQAVRDYLKVIDVKIVKARNAKQTVKLSILKADKAATLARWNKLKASLEVAPPQAVAPVPPPAPVVVKPAASAGLFGMGLNTSLSGLYISTGKGSLSGSIGAMGNLVLDDFIGLGPMVGLSANAVKFKVGTGYVMGGGGLKAVPVYGGGIISLPAEWMGGLDSYLTGGLNYVAYGNGQTSGKLGGDVYFGINADLGLGLGKTGFEIGYNVVRSNTVTSKGISLSVCQPIVL